MIPVEIVVPEIPEKIFDKILMKKYEEIPEEISVKIFRVSLRNFRTTFWRNS